MIGVAGLLTRTVAEVAAPKSKEIYCDEVFLAPRGGRSSCNPHAGDDRVLKHGRPAG
jgi:hypothetical protein